MYLKSIEMSGFKSFADKTKIEFNDSLTCIVGPNGSGKSNITDAIQWVLGEQSSLTLRGSQMSDVIFKGTDHRRPLGLAEVIIIFDNSQKIFDLDYQTVEIKRKLYRSGESGYYINNVSCRLKDIRNLLMDTGIGRSGYSIIGQGRISDILNSQPKDRLAIFEEASGISRYKSEKLEIEKKLINTEDNILRLADIIREIENQKTKLKSDSEKAKKYIDLFNDMKLREIAVGSHYHSIYNSEIEDLKTKKKNKEFEKTDLEKNIVMYEELYKKHTKELDQLDRTINELQGLNLDTMKKERDLNSSIDVSKERLKSLTESINKSESLIVENKIKIKDRQLKINDINKSRDVLQNNTINMEELLKTVEEDKSKKQDELLSLKNSLEVFNKKYNELNLMISKLNMTMENSQLLQSENTILSQKIKSQLDEINKDIISCEELKTEYEKSDKDLKTKLKKIKKAIEKNNEKLISLNKKLDTIKEKEYSVSRTINSNIARFQMLENMESNYEGYNKSIKNFFRYVERESINIPELRDTVGSIIKVDSKYEKAITTALGGAVQNLIVETFSSAQYIIKLLRDNNLGRITFLPMDNIKVYSNRKIIESEGLIDRASNLVEYDNEYKNIIDNLLSNILVVDGLNNAKIISNNNPRSRVVTLDGDIIYPGGSITGGQSSFAGNILSRKNEIDNLRIQISKDNKLLKKIEDEIIHILEDIDDEKSRSIELDTNLKESNKDFDEIRYKVYQLETNLNSKLDKHKDLLSQQNTIEENKTLSVTDMKDLEDNLNSYRSSLESNKESISKKNKEIDLCNGSISKINNKINEYQITLVEKRSKLEFLKEDLNRNKEEIVQLNDSTTSVQKDIDNNKENIAEINKNIDNNINILNTIKEEISINKKEYDKFLLLRKELQEKSRKDGEELNNKKLLKIQLDQDIYNLHSEFEKIQSKIKNNLEKIGERYGYTIISCEFILDERDLNDLEEYLKIGDQKLKKLGNVNINALNEYKNVLERYNFKTNQFNDLTESKDKLKDILYEVESVMEKQFIKNFKIINDKFSKIFIHMFGGGNAKLVLTKEDEDVFGVDIEAQLPGKRKQPLSALSGGERSMTTVSLLFAFLETRPSPFCLLDEIDAALDESNIGRFTNYLKTLDEIQFAIITHRKATMDSANCIYGVTMEEPGVSKVVSLKFEEGEKVV